VQKHREIQEERSAFVKVTECVLFVHSLGSRGGSFVLSIQCCAKLKGKRRLLSVDQTSWLSVATAEMHAVKKVHIVKGKLTHAEKNR